MSTKNNLVVMQEEQRQSSIHTSEYVIRKHIAYIDEEITHPSNYREIITTLLSASENDIVEFVINTNGGDVQAALAIIEAIKMTQAQVRATVIGNCYSAGTIIAMNCPEVYISDSAEFILHSASWVVAGSASNIKAQNDFVYAQTTKLVTETYDGFLSQKEIKELIAGKEFWFTSEEAKSRLIARSKKMAQRNKRNEEA